MTENISTPYQIVLSWNVDEQMVALFVGGRPDQQLVVAKKIDDTQDGLGV